MSLVDFIKLPEIRDIYKKHAVRTSMILPEAVYSVPCADTRMAGAIGTAFDYMVRFRMAALAENRGIGIVEGEWIAEKAVASLAGIPHFRMHAPRWQKFMQAARKLQLDNVHTPADPVRLARCSQFLGAADLLYRVGTFRPDFSAPDAVTSELMALDACFPYEALLPEKGSVYLNPELHAGDDVGGADPDIISGSAIIDIKTTIKPSADASRMRQICAYAVLCNRSGIKVNGIGHSLPRITHAGFAFSRQGIHVQYELNELFRDGYEAFHEEMDEAMRDYGKGRESRETTLSSSNPMYASV